MITAFDIRTQTYPTICIACHFNFKFFCCDSSVLL